MEHATFRQTGEPPRVNRGEKKVETYEKFRQALVAPLLENRQALLVPG